jgi:hypothetical protein
MLRGERAEGVSGFRCPREYHGLVGRNTGEGSGEPGEERNRRRVQIVIGGHGIDPGRAGGFGVLIPSPETDRSVFLCCRPRWQRLKAVPELPSSSTMAFSSNGPQTFCKQPHISGSGRDFMRTRFTRDFLYSAVTFLTDASLARVDRALDYELLRAIVYTPVNPAFSAS